MTKNITTQTLSRLPLYFNYLTSLPEDKKNGNISATAIAEALGLNDVQVRKDLASVSRGGRPKVGYSASELMGDIGKFLGFENHDGVVVAGMGNRCHALPDSVTFLRRFLHSVIRHLCRGVAGVRTGGSELDGANHHLCCLLGAEFAFCASCGIALVSSQRP